MLLPTKRLTGHAVFVAIQRMYRKDAWDWQPAGDSYLAVIDTNTDALVDVDPAASGTQGVRLAATNPGSLRALKGQVFVHPSETGGVLTQIVQR